MKNALTSFLDLSSLLTLDQLLDFIQFASDEVDKKAIHNLCENDTAFQNWQSKNPNILDLLRSFPSIKIPAAALVASLSKLMPRTYSIASIDPKLSSFNGKKIVTTDLLLDVVEFNSGPFLSNESPPELRKGVASNFLIQLPIGGGFLSYHQPNDQFKLPNKPLPILMVCTGSGIAPFRGFWQKRIMNGYEKSTTWLFFGCRDETENMFEAETADMVQRVVAYSRKGKDYPKKYVQDLLEDESSLIYRFVFNQKANVYICGKVNNQSTVCYKPWMAGYLVLTFAYVSNFNWT